MIDKFWNDNKILITSTAFLIAILTLFLTIPLQQNNEKANDVLNHLIVFLFVMFFILLVIIFLKINNAFLKLEFSNKHTLTNFIMKIGFSAWIIWLLYYLSLFIYYSYKNSLFILLEKIVGPILFAVSTSISLIIMSAFMRIFKKTLFKTNWLGIIFIPIFCYVALVFFNVSKLLYFPMIEYKNFSFFYKDIFGFKFFIDTTWQPILTVIILFFITTEFYSFKKRFLKEEKIFKKITKKDKEEFIESK